MSDPHKHIRERLLRAYAPDEPGVWKILGEDPNCDLGGHHHQPELEIITGTYKNVVDYALKLPQFFTWGGGGNIKKQAERFKNIDKLVSNQRYNELKSERVRLTERLAQVEKELKEELRKAEE